MKQHQDVLVIGSGPVGMAVARRLAEGGLRVTVLEAGSAVTEPPGSHVRNQPGIRNDPDGYFAAIDQYLRPVIDPAKATVLPGAADSSLMGGQGILWTNNCPRAAEFERWEAMTPGEWEQKYVEAEHILQVKRDEFVRSKTGRGIRECLREHLGNDGRALDDLPFSGRILPSGELYYNAPHDILSSAAPEIQSFITVQTGVRVTRLIVHGNRVMGVEVDTADNSGAMLDAPIVFVAGGAVATPQLLHRSGIRPAALGRGFSFHALLFGQIILDSELCSAASDTDIAPRLYVPPTPGLPWHIMLLRDTCPLPATEEVPNPHSLMEFQAFLPVESRDANTLVIDDESDDEFQFAFSRADRERMRAMEADVRRLARELGQWRLGCEPTWIPHGSAHLMGTCRMDRPNWPGVTDAAGKVHGFDNLYLASAGLIPAPLAENPTPTAVALALKACDPFVR